MRAILFVILLSALAMFAAARGLPPLWLGLLPFAAVFARGERLAILGFVGVVFDLLSTHPFGAAAFIFVCYGFVLGTVRKFLLAQVALYAVALSAVTVLLVAAFPFIGGGFSMFATISPVLWSSVALGVLATALLNYRGMQKERVQLFHESFHS